MAALLSVWTVIIMAAPRTQVGRLIWQAGLYVLFEAFPGQQGAGNLILGHKHRLGGRQLTAAPNKQACKSLLGCDRQACSVLLLPTLVLSAEHTALAICPVLCSWWLLYLQAAQGQLGTLYIVEEQPCEACIVWR